MTKEKIVIHLFDILNETNELPIQDLIIDYPNHKVDVFLTDGTRFSLHIAEWGLWHLAVKHK